MKRPLILLTIILSVAATAAAQIGTRVSVSAGTPEDKALAEIYAAADGPDKIALLDKFAAEFGSNNELALLTDQIYAQTYLAMKNYAKVYEYGEKAVAIDSLNLASVITMIHAADEQGDAKKLFALGDKAIAIVTQYKALPPPSGVSDVEWTHTNEENVKRSQDDINYVQYALANAAFKTADPAARAALFERYVAAFPDSPYTPSVREQIPIAYQQAQNTAKMLETAQKILEADPNNVSMLLLLTDYWSQNGLQLDKAAAYAQKALDLLAQAKKPDNLTDEQWQQQISIQKGLAYSALGQIHVNKGRNPQAVEAFQKAGPLLKSDTVSYARNLYRLGFTLAKMQRIPEAREALT
ncbi:MAG: hypothetical protein WBP79_00680, partial [Candidatus Acidiferrales bacterium]